LALALGREGLVKEIILSLLLIIFMGVSRTGLLESMLKSLPAWLGQVLRLVLFLQAGLIVAWSALLTFRAVEIMNPQARAGEAGPQRTPRYGAFLRLGMAIFILINLIYTIFWVAIWDHADNGLGGVWMAIQKYFKQNGAYPTTLSELVPSQLLWVPCQVLLRSEDWYYQSGQDYYRLGVFWRDRFSSLLEAKTYASQGNPPEAGWACQKDLVKMKFKYDPTPLIGGEK
jgi:hypothetical protein